MRARGNGFLRERHARLVSFNTSSISLTSASSSLFGLSRFDGGESWIQAGQAHRWATQIQVVGTYADNSTTVQVFNLDLVKSPLLGMETFTLNNSFAGGLEEGCIHGHRGNPEFSLDNIAVAAVPEPETYALLLAGPGAHGYRGASPQGSPRLIRLPSNQRNPAAAGFCYAPRAPGSGLHELATACDGTHQAETGHQERPGFGLGHRAPMVEHVVVLAIRHCPADAVEGAVEANGAVAFMADQRVADDAQAGVQPPQWPLPWLREGEGVFPKL